MTDVIGELVASGEIETACTDSDYWSGGEGE
jgi:hypothetical protein